ncbi:unnamed protein product [Chrysoparadoxa australica]
MSLDQAGAAQAQSASSPAPGSSAAPYVASPSPAPQSTWSHPSGITLKQQNITASMNLSGPINLRQVVLSARNAEYNPKRFAACIMRLREPKATALVFSSGKMVVTGTKSEDDAKLASRKFQRIIMKVDNPNLKMKDFTTQNMVVTVDMGFPIRLEGLVYAHAQFASYEPELFPGLIYRLANPRVVLLVFVSGKVVLTGGKKLEHLQQAFDKMYPVLCEFKKKSVMFPTPALPAAAASAGATS